MADHPNAQVYRRFLQAFMDSDWDAVEQVVAPSVVWHEAGNPEPLRGRDAVLDRLRSLDTGDFDNSATIHDVVANDDHVVAMVRAAIRHGDRQISYPAVEVAHVRDGMVTERWAMMDAVPDDVDEFFSTLTE